MRKKICLSFLICFIVLFCVACLSISESTEEAIINDKDGVFDTTVDELINILNSEIKKENLPLMPTEYEESKHDDSIVYAFQISDKFIIWFVNYLEKGDGIHRIGLTFTGEIIKYNDSLEGEGETIYEISEETEAEAVKYYKAICNILKPKFKAEQFISDEEDNTASIEYDNYVFHTTSIGTFNEEDIVGKTIIIYEAISSKEIFYKYQEEIEDGDYVDFE